MAKSKSTEPARRSRSSSTLPSKKVTKDEVELLDAMKMNDGDELQPGQPLGPEDVEEMNPFLLIPVVKAIMSQMTIDDLKRSRGVCQLWDESSTLELQKLTSQMKVQKFENAHQLVKFVKTFEESPNKVFILQEMGSTLKVISPQGPSFFETFKPKSLIIKAEHNDTNVNSKFHNILQKASRHLEKFHVTGPVQHKQFDWTIKWTPLELPQLEELTISDLLFDYKDIQDTHFMFTNLTKNVPKLKSLNLYNHPINDPICELLTSNGLIEKLKEFRIGYGSLGSDLAFSKDLLDMAQNGLKLSKFSINLTFLRRRTKDVILDHFEKLKDFLKTQSDTLVDLSICLEIDIDAEGYSEDMGKFSMPPLPKLKVLVLEIGNTWKDSEIHLNSLDLPLPYSMMNLPSIFPNLREMTIDLSWYFCDLSKIFKGSLEGVKKLTIKQPDGNSFKNISRCRLLEQYFPHVVDFEMDHTDNFKYKHIPWKKTLKKLTIHPPTLANLKFVSLSHLKELSRLELINKRPRAFVKPTNFDFDSLSRTNVKTLKIRNYLIHVNVVEKNKSRFNLDYITLNRPLQKQTREEFLNEIGEQYSMMELIDLLQEFDNAYE